MAKGVRISLANKCQLLFGAAVILILAAALAVVSLRMQKLVERVPRARADDFASAWLADQSRLGGAVMPLDTADHGRADLDLKLTPIHKDQFDQADHHDPFLRRAVERFQLQPETRSLFTAARDRKGKRYYRYARAVRRSDLAHAPRLADDAAASSSAASAGLVADPLEMVLLVRLRDPQAVAQTTINRIYILAAGIFAGLLAIGVFWFISTRIILSPVRLLRDYAAKVSQGDLNTRSDINTGDEFEELSNVFNTMLENLKSNQDQLRSINKSLDLRLGELAQTNVALYEANKMKGEFLANVSHELRTPLNSIIGFAEVLQEALADAQAADPTTEKRKRYAGHIINSSRRLLDLINDLLDLAKIEAGRMDLHVGPLSVADTCEGLIALMKPQAAKGDITLRLKVEPNLPIIQTDAGKLQQILFNFLANAVKFTPPGGTVLLQAGLEPSHATPPLNESSSEEAGIRLSVSDTGPGIRDEDQERIFDPFTQLDRSETREHGGTGLGLAISRELARMLQGRIELDSDLGRGATFSLVIPRSPQQRSAPLMPA